MTKFTDLTDVPQSYSGNSGKLVTVKSDQTGLGATWAAPASYEADLRDFLPVGATVYSGPHQGTDVKPYLEAALDAVKARYGRGAVVIPGQYRIASGINPAKLRGMTLKGISRASCALVYDANSGTALHWDGGQGYTGGGIEDLAIFLDAGYPSSTAFAIRLQGDASSQPGSMNFERVLVTVLGSGSDQSYWYAGLYALGRDKTSGARGIRVLRIDTMELFAASNCAAYFENVVNAHVSMLGTFTGKAGTGGMDVYVQGYGSAGANDDFHLTEFDIGGKLQVVDTSGGMLSGRCGSFVTNSTMVNMWGFVRTGSSAGAVASSNRLTIW